MIDHTLNHKTVLLHQVTAFAMLRSERYPVTFQLIGFQLMESVTIHPSSYVDAPVRIGAGTRIWHFCHVMSGSVIGGNCVIGQNVAIGPQVTIGDGCKIQNNVSIYKGVTLEDDVFCGPSVVFTNVINPRAFIRRMEELKPTLVRQGATLGANCTIVCGVTIGRYAMIGAGAVVTRDVSDYALVMGNPARQTGWVGNVGNRCEGPEGVEMEQLADA